MGMYLLGCLHICCTPVVFLGFPIWSPPYRPFTLSGSFKLYSKHAAIAASLGSTDYTAIGARMGESDYLVLGFLGCSVAYMLTVLASGLLLY